jgi:4'-phosphopantetheinyl transferase
MSAPLWEAAPQEARLSADEVHVFVADLDGPPPVDCLSPDERARAARFHFARDQRRFVAARALLRGLLGRYLGLDPAEVVFGYGPRGKPFLAAPPRSLRFNVSHSDGLALLAFAEGRELGIDLERERPLSDAEGIAGRFFSAGEGKALFGLPEGERGRAFFRCWTRKEAFIKATGDGLSRPLDGFEVTVGPGEDARLLRVDGEPEEVGRWWLQDVEPAAGFLGALAVAGRPARVALWRWDGAKERSHGPRRERRQDDLQSRAEPRGAVLDLAG